jgi:hypothetical protein
MICESCHCPISEEIQFSCTDNNVPIGARQRYIVRKKLCFECGETYKFSQLPNGIYMITRSLMKKPKNPKKPKAEPREPKVVLMPSERETIVNFDDSSPDCTVFTCSKILWTRLEKLGYTLIDSTDTSRTFSCLKKHISFKSIIVKPKRVMTDIQKENLTNQ